MLDIKCVVAIVERGKADKIVKAAKVSGASGATIFYGRGTGESEVKKFLSVNIEASKEVILILSEREKLKAIITAMVDAGDLKKPGTGIIFTVPVGHLIGLHHREDFDDLDDI
nr:P-II family nitrogen regulator [Tissierella sp.]